MNVAQTVVCMALTTPQRKKKENKDAYTHMY